MSEGFNDAAKTVMAHKIAETVDEYLTPLIESVIRQAKAEAWDEGQGYALRNGGGKFSDNPYQEQEEA